jgi:hypothetical protein
MVPQLPILKVQAPKTMKKVLKVAKTSIGSTIPYHHVLAKEKKVVSSGIVVLDFFN